MRVRWQRWLSLGVFGSAFLTCSPYLCATTYSVVIQSPGFSLVAAVLDFQFIDGGDGSGTNTVTLSPITSDGTPVSTSISGSVSGTGPWLFSDTAFFNELLVDFHPLGTMMSFSFTTSDNFDGGIPDAFSFFVLDATGTSPLFMTSDPTGADALFELDINGLGADGLHVYMPEQGYTIEVTAAAVPEPGSLALLASGFVAFFLRKRFKQ